MRHREPGPTIASLVLQSLYTDLAAHREAFDRGLERFGITVFDLEDIHGQVSLRSFVRLFEWLAVELRDPWLGLRLSQRAGPHALGALGYLFLCSRSLETAFQLASRYLRANQTASTLQLEIAGQLVHIRYEIDDDTIAPRRQDSEYSTGITWRYIKLLTRNQCHLTQVSFEHERPRGQTPLYNRIFDAPVIFGQGSNEIVLPVEDFRRRHEGLDPHLFPILEDHIANTLAQSELPRTFLESVDALITEETLGRGASAALIADKLKISTVTLHRRLRNEGFGFKDRIESRRKLIAERLLHHGNLPIATIATRLGFSDPATFTRACRRWFDMTPRELRISSRSQPAGNPRSPGLDDAQSRPARSVDRSFT
jgi:AraC-like DNA-binding protein